MHTISMLTDCIQDSGALGGIRYFIPKTWLALPGGQGVNLIAVVDLCSWVYKSEWSIVADEATSPAIRSSSESSSLSFLRRRFQASSADKGALRSRSTNSWFSQS
ncbi:hypothetical protein AMELA_G00026130 [Ameiurus melas]|uniref:Uncharacterized protein n=1 Tax=Ameiurus melas TaxID=219545 RepID=A0A7J6BEZ3_AMEME|nr:hypothetical protein AMELA_G00026130 [Ameiurus melas]